MAVKITNLGYWERYVPDPVPSDAPEGAAFARRVGDGKDWYALAYGRNAFPAGAFIAVAIPATRVDGVEGNIVQAVQPAEKAHLIFPAGQWLLLIEGVPADQEKPWKLFEQQNFDPVEATISPFPEIAPPAPVTFKADIWRRCSDEEAEQLDADLSAQPAKIRRTFADAQLIQHDDPLFGMMQAAITARFGPERAAEILAPST